MKEHTDLSIEIKRLEKEIVTLNDGFKYYWPEGPGAFSAHSLREIADYLDELNKDWSNIIDQM